METCASKSGLWLFLLAWGVGLGMGGQPAPALDASCQICDTDADQLIGAVDLQAFVGCMTGTELGPPQTSCTFADLDGDGDVDQSDFGLFQRCLGEKVGPRDVFITELLAEDNHTLRDQDGDSSDWIELYNAGTRTAELEGCWLTDDPNQPTLWRFPAVYLRSGAHLVVFASGKDRATAGAELHTNFKLSKEGGYLALFMPDGVTATCAYAPAYPPQRADISYGMQSDAEPPLESELVGSATPAMILVPTNEDLGLTWTEVGFPDGGWTPATTRIGYERGSGYEDLIATDVQAAMYNQNQTIYIRIPFALADPGAVQGLTLRMMYDDGFIAYLNGEKVAERNAPATPTYNSGASGEHPDAVAVVFEDMDLSAQKSLLHAGANVLAIHGLNFRTTSSDFLIVPELRAELTVEHPTIYRPDQLRYFAIPTPGRANGVGLLGFVSDTHFDVDRGFYSEPFQVAITTATAGAIIRFTTDGSIPTETTGTVYTGPITVGTTTTLRAAAFKSEYVPSNVDTQTYLFPEDVIHQPNNPAGFPTQWGGVTNSVIAADYEMDPDIINSPTYSGRVVGALRSIPSLSLVMETAAWFDPYTGIYSNAAMEGFAWERAVSAELLYPDGRPGFHVNCGVRMQGGTSPVNWKVPKISMRLLFKDMYGPGRLDFPLFADSPVSRFNTLVLDAHLHTWLHPSDVQQRRRAQYVRDAMASNLQLATGWPSVHSRYVHLYVNGLYWGLYHVHERPDAAFGEDYYGGDEEDYDVIRHNEDDVVAGDNAAYRAMMDLANAGLASTAAYADIQRYLDIDAFIDYMLVNFWGCNRDWAHQNWYASRSRQPGGRFRYVSWDAEHIISSYPTQDPLEGPYSDLTADNTTRNDGYGSPTFLHQRLCANAEYKLRFADHAHQHFFNGGLFYVDPANGAWDPARPERNRPAATYMKLIEEIDAAIIMESARWGDYRSNPDRPGQPYERDVEWINEVNRLLTTYFPYRSAVSLQQLKNRGLYPDVTAPVFSQHGGVYPAGFALTMSPADSAIWYTLDDSDPRLPGGAVGGTAVPYTGPVPLSGTVRVKARVLAGGTWSALTEAVFTAAAPPVLRITELMYHPPAGGAYDAEEYEFIEIVNVGGADTELSGVRLGGGVEFTFPQMILPAGTAVVVVENPAAFAERYGSGLSVAGRYSGKLSNSSDTLVLSDALGQVILSFSYFDWWYPLTDGSGYSLCIRDAHGDPSTWGDAAAWQASVTVLGTPGAVGP